MKKNKETVTSILSVILTVFFGFLAIYFWWDGKKVHSISYSVSKDAALIFNHKNSQGLALYEKDSIPIKQDVHMIQGFIWNDGDYSIDKADIRRAIEFKVADNCRILDYKIIKQTEADIARFKLNKIDNNTLNLDWTYFDPRYGCSFQIIYAGDEVDPQFKIMGSVVNIDGFNLIEKPNISKVSIIVNILLCLLFLTILIRTIIKANKTLKEADTTMRETIKKYKELQEEHKDFFNNFSDFAEKVKDKATAVEREFEQTNNRKWYQRLEYYIIGVGLITLTVILIALTTYLITWMSTYNIPPELL